MHHQGTPEIKVAPGIAMPVPLADSLYQCGGIEAQERGESRKAAGGLDPAFGQFGAVVLAPVVALDDLSPTMARVLVIEWACGKESVVQNQKHWTRSGQR